MIKSLLVTALTVSLFASTDAQAAEKKALSAAQVKKTFVGRIWYNTNGKFLFKRNNTYTYTRGNQTFGPWSYKLHPNGIIQGSTTTYQFFKLPNGTYQYFHGKSRKYFRAIIY